MSTLGWIIIVLVCMSASGFWFYHLAGAKMYRRCREKHMSDLKSIYYLLDWVMKGGVLILSSEACSGSGRVVNGAKDCSGPRFEFVGKDQILLPELLHSVSDRINRHYRLENILVCREKMLKGSAKDFILFCNLVHEATTSFAMMRMN